MLNATRDTAVCRDVLLKAGLVLLPVTQYDDRARAPAAMQFQTPDSRSRSCQWRCRWHCRRCISSAPLHQPHWPDQRPVTGEQRLARSAGGRCVTRSSSCLQCAELPPSAAAEMCMRVHMKLVRHHRCRQAGSKSTTCKASEIMFWAVCILQSRSSWRREERWCRDRPFSWCTSVRLLASHPWLQHRPSTNPGPGPTLP